MTSRLMASPQKVRIGLLVMTVLVVFLIATSGSTLVSVYQRERERFMGIVKRSGLMRRSGRVHHDFTPQGTWLMKADAHHAAIDRMERDGLNAPAVSGLAWPQVASVSFRKERVVTVHSSVREKPRS